LTQRLTDYALVALVILLIFVLFRISRILMKRVIGKLEDRYGKLDSDRVLITGFTFLLSGLLFLPIFTAGLAVLDSEHLAGGMVLHLILVAVSIIVFSISEDMFREFAAPERTAKDRWPVSRHFRTLALPLIIFWAAGVLFLSPLFYSGLTLVLCLFYLYALSCRRSPGEEAEPSE